jgi:N-acetylglutamate synthase-like GNAT family acetyltransferase
MLSIRSPGANVRAVQITQFGGPEDVLPLVDREEGPAPFDGDVHRAPRHRVAEVAVLRPAAVSDTEAVLAMLARCSRATLFHRFHGFADGAAYFDALLRDGPVQQTLLAWYGATCVGVAVLGVDATGVVDLGVLVEDAWQHRGIGTQLTDSLLDSARAKGVSIVHAEVLSDDRHLLRALRRIGPLAASIEHGVWLIDVALNFQPTPSAGDMLPVVPEACTVSDRGLDQQLRSCAIS